MDRALITTAREWLPTGLKPDPRFFDEEGFLLDFDARWAENCLRMIREETWMDSTPGLPWMAMGCATNAEVLTRFENLVPGIIYGRLRERLKLTASHPLALAEAEANVLVKSNLQDPVRLFIKDEPHSRKKAELGRWRIISNMSIIDIACSRMLGQPLLTRCVDEWARPDRSVNTGMGLHDEGIANIFAKVHALEAAGEELAAGAIISSDAKAYDWSVQQMDIRLGFQTIASCFELGSEEDHNSGDLVDCDFTRLLIYEGTQMCNKMYVLPDGHMCHDRTPGKIISGSFWTALLNSIIRNQVSYRRGSAVAQAMGDDALELWIGNIPQHLADGYVVEYEELPADVHFEFCSHHFMYDGRAIPLNTGKSLYKLLQRTPDQQAVAEFGYEMRHHPHRDRMLAWIYREWQLPPPADLTSLVSPPA
nr:MAG: hypothetical protein 2 [Sobelivirales sp.]